MFINIFKYYVFIVGHFSNPCPIIKYNLLSLRKVSLPGISLKYRFFLEYKLFILNNPINDTKVIFNTWWYLKLKIYVKGYK